MEKDVLDLFKVMVISNDQKDSGIFTDLAGRGVVTDFMPTGMQRNALRNAFNPLDVVTLFSRDEVETAYTYQLLTKQILHYVEVYGLNKPGLFDLEIDNGKLVTMTYVRGVSIFELGDMVRDLLYTNAPIKDVEQLKRIVEYYAIEYDVNKIRNNEARIVLYTSKDHFNDGDDVVRYMCYKATGSALLIKDLDSMRQIKRHIFTAAFFEKYRDELAKVFNRHKKLILAAKNANTKTAINQISRASKHLHVPVGTPAKKTFIADSLKGDINLDVLNGATIRDKFKFLNLLAFKRMRLSTDMFVIRNGKVHFEENRPVYKFNDIARVEEVILDSIEDELKFLKTKTILLDKNVDYGLPTSRKQAVGQLPFYTKVSVKDRISAGIYWHNDYGASDLDLSTIDMKGNRIGWGQLSGYDRKSNIRFSGDVTNAYNGAMEFMTSNGVAYGLFVNIYSGGVGCGMNIVVGSDADDRWIDAPIINEKTTLQSRNMIVGFVNDKEYTVFQGRINNSRISGDNPSIVRATADNWTISKLFDVIGVNYHLDNDPDIIYDYDMRYKGFSFDKLENLFTN